MKLASPKDRQHVVNILASSFDDNKSVNYTIKQDSKRFERIKSLMEYSFDVCHLFGKVFLSDDRKGCALIVLPDKKRTTFKSLLLDLKLIFRCIGLANAKQVMAREAKIKKRQPREPIYYLWFIGVQQGEQGAGIGTLLLHEIIEESQKDKRMICLETSTLKNIPWYQKFGFSIYNDLYIEYKLFFLKRDASK